MSSQFKSDPNMAWKDPKIIGAGAFFLGFAIASGRVNWLVDGLTQLGGSVGSLVLTHFSRSLREHNPQIFNSSEKPLKTG